MRETENCTLKLTIFYFLFGHKLSWATAYFVRCNGIFKYLTIPLHLTK